ncbi:MAG: class I SAM-dependent methyltransferase [Patescibacteria group bacterium]
MEEKIICPICNSDGTNFYCEKNGCKICRCQSCGTAFVYPIPANPGDIYNKEYFKKETGSSFGYSDYDKDKEPMRNIFISYIKKIENLVEDRNIFDIGAATGYFLDLAKERGWRTAGTEISDYAASVAGKRGHRISCGKFPEMKIEEKFGAITMWDVLEHLDNPIEYLRAANKILMKDGRLIVNTINRESLWARIFGKRWHSLVPPEHLFYYSPKGLKILLEEAGFEIEESGTSGKIFSLSYIFGILHHWQKIKIWDGLSKFFDRSFWRKLSLPINLGDNILIIAKK